MKLTVKSNGRIIAAEVKKVEATGDIHAVELDFECSPLWSDLEIWLEDDDGKLCDHLRMNVSKRKKLSTYK